MYFNAWELKTCRWDVNGDKHVGIDDIVETSEHYGGEIGDPDWNQKYDMNCDGYVGIDDIVAVSEHFGESC